MVVAGVHTHEWSHKRSLLRQFSHTRHSLPYGTTRTSTDEFRPDILFVLTNTEAPELTIDQVFALTFTFIVF